MNPLKRSVTTISGLLVLFSLSACMDTTGNSERHYDNTPDIEFLLENRDKEGVTVTNSGLQYRILEVGDVDGPSPGPTSEVSVYYTGWFVDGRVFDGTREGEPAEFSLNEVIAGWTEGIQLMTVGSTYRFYIPSALGYGDDDWYRNVIPPGATLIFEVELLDIL